MTDMDETPSSQITLTADIEGAALPKENVGLQTDEFPEGGLQAWATVAGAFIVQFCGFGYTTSFGVYQDFYTREYLSQSSASAISWIGSINAFLIISGGLVAGRVYDRGHFYLLVCGGALLQCFSLFMLSLCKPQQLYQIFLAQGLGTGLGSGAMYVPTMAVVSHYFRRRRTLAMAIVATGTPLGAVIHPIMLNHTLSSSALGFGNAVRASAGLVSVLLIVACLLMRPRLPPAPNQLPFWESLWRFARDRAYVFTTLGMATYAVGVYFPLFYLQLDAVKHGVNDRLAFYSLVIMNGASVVGRLTPAFFAGRAGNKIFRVMILAAGCGAVSILCMIAVKNSASVVVVGVLYGLSVGVYITLIPPLLAILTEDIKELGLRMGVAFAVMGVGGLVGPPINGALLASDYVWWRPALFSGLTAVFGVCCFVATLLELWRRNNKNVATDAEAGLKVGVGGPH
ncbi:MFS general substrate transporter [Mycena sanguinolenta]|uniref:MFS general substrate transporter n=1 Tax=Mycena sanguinolenta TaxID=230812 RepID=A0A8H7CWA3_9AGAR|nr:MFS general substrate transporter [Mycena sanguinolenta]